MHTSLIIPGSEPFLIPAGATGCLLLHGFTCTPEEMRWLGEDLAGRGHTVLGLRLAGHATHPRDLARTRWHDWLVSVEDGLAILRGACQRIFIIGLSMGGINALIAAARHPIAGVVAMSTPYQTISSLSVALLHLTRWLRPMVAKRLPERHPTLPDRREASYPAYPAFPTRVLLEVAKLQAEMRAVLPQVNVPALLIHSRADAAVPPESMEHIYAHLDTPHKEMLWLEDFDHAVVRDPRREVVFEAIADFIHQVTAS